MNQLKYKVLAFCIFAVGCQFRVVALPGTGSSSDPWKIQNLSDFSEFCSDSGYWLSGTYAELEADLDLSGTVFSEAPIAPDLQTNSWYQGVMYSGSFNGKGHVVKNLTISGGDETWYMSLFGYLGDHGTIENLGVIDCDIVGGYRVSGICGWNRGTIRKCYSSGKIKGYTNVAGICGLNDGGTITQCFSRADVRGTAGPSFTGGIIGINDGPVSECFSFGNVTGQWWIGGFCADNRSTIDNCYVLGTVYGLNANYEDGFCADGGEGVTGCFWNKETSGTSISDGGIGKTTTQMKLQETFTAAHWEFSNVWKMSAAYGGYEGYPILQWMDDLVGYNHWVAIIPEGWRGAEDCPSGDKIVNLMKYASGLDPDVVCSTADLYTVSNSPATLTVNYYKSKDAPDALIYPVFNGSLLGGTWEPSQVSPVLIQDGDHREIWEVTIPNEKAGFIRLKAELVE